MGVNTMVIPINNPIKGLPVARPTGKPYNNQLSQVPREVQLQSMARLQLNNR